MKVIVDRIQLLPLSNNDTYPPPRAHSTMRLSCHPFIVNQDKSQLYETEIFGLNSDNPKSDPSNILQLSFSPSMTHLALTGAVRDHCIMSSPSASSNVSNDDDHGDDVTVRGVWGAGVDACPSS